MKVKVILLLVDNSSMASQSLFIDFEIKNMPSVGSCLDINDRLFNVFHNGEYDITLCPFNTNDFEDTMNQLIKEGWKIDYI